MKRETINYFSVGLFVLAGLAVLLFALFRIVSGVGDRDTYYTRYRNVAGVSPGTMVTYEGYALGHVSAIEPQRSAAGTEYQVEMKLQQGWQIPTDSVARVHSEGLLADTVVNISEGHAQTFLEPGGTLKGEQGIDLVASMGDLAADIGDMSHAILPLMENLGRAVTQVGGELQTRLPSILDGVQRLVTKLDASATHLSGVLNADTEAQTRRVLDNVESAAADFKVLTSGLVEVKRDARALIGRLDSLVTQNQPDLRQSVTDLRRILQQVSRYSDGILQNLDGTSRNMSEFSRQIRENPGRLLGGPAPQDLGVRRD
jgi:phospholipid/cholesterol/gamma-HCH transport system substrate-binding protein